jgi:hypothetical protein
MIRQRKSITHVTFALSRHRDIDGQYDRLATGGFGALRQRGADCPILKYVELEPDGPGGNRHGFLDRSGRKSRQVCEGLGGAGRPSRGDFSFRVRKALKRRGSNQDRHRDRLTQNGGAHVPHAHIDQHARKQRDSLIGCPVLAQSDLVVGATRIVVVSHLGQQLARACFQLPQIDGIDPFTHGWSFLSVAVCSNRVSPPHQTPRRS